ncbi:MAG TPA: flagellar hook-basal body complex protein [Phycisphaerae bacterium]|nr:flagellar hook-basal body complex protein [Phycisphaerae bacterium]HOJ74298.1 flagellar hook-basal body complex protein [Phycisphaerae bacterium]HOM51377.1 flagellar hook-basal body complex protein [Phycisphaerae bacterium]HON66915.1 flagellar hook-basal body complex protein [Phycisphaerae bacterium]HPP26660.1 flagellar hook-basal body complex protein [Phycisphaerae bacterium]
MGLTSAMYTGLTGLNTNQFRIDTSGDNIANVNTTAFKSSRANFENLMSKTVSNGTAPSDRSGGTNPLQIGMGSALSSVQRNFSNGSIEPTGIPTDMAIEGNGFFIVNTPAYGQAFTRDGTFKLDATNTLVTADGFKVQGYGVDDNFNIIPGELQDITIPLGTMSAARATSNVAFDGNLNANGPIASQGTILESQAFVDLAGNPATANTLLSQLVDPGAPGVPLFAEGDVITLANVKKGGRQLPEERFTVTADSTLGDFAAFLQNSLGINTDPEAGGTPGVRISDGSDGVPAGTLVVEGNAGTANGLEIDLSAIRSSNINFNVPFNFTETQAANGESVYTTFIAYDSLGTPIQVELTLVLDSKTNAGNVWRYYAESHDDTDVSSVLGGTGTLTFDNDGQLTAVSNNIIRIDRENTGALNPLQIELNFDHVTGLTTQRSAMVMTSQDGFGTGTLNSFSVGSNGMITGTFSNGLTRPLGQIALATFTNAEGLVGKVNNLYLVGPNSGPAVITAPEELGAGRVVSGALELSNVDLTREFIGLITASTGFSASGRVISTSNELLNELLLIAR